MDKTRAAMQQALEALEALITYDYHGNPDNGRDVAGAEAITALREALAEQAELGTVAIMSPNKANIVGINTPYANIGTDDWIKLYAAPVRTKDLTEAEIDEIWKKHSGGNLGFAYAVIAADREKNK